MPWSVTNLSLRVTQDGKPGYAWQMAATATEHFPFDAEEAVTSATATLRDTTDPAAPVTLPTPSVAGNIVIVTVDGEALELVRGHAYELLIAVVRTSGAVEDEHTLIIEVVA